MTAARLIFGVGGVGVLALTGWPFSAAPFQVTVRRSAGLEIQYNLAVGRCWSYYGCVLPCRDFRHVIRSAPHR
jgi:hypothetical protein